MSCLVCSSAVLQAKRLNRGRGRAGIDTRYCAKTSIPKKLKRAGTAHNSNNTRGMACLLSGWHGMAYHDGTDVT